MVQKCIHNKVKRDVEDNGNRRGKSCWVRGVMVEGRGGLNPSEKSSSKQNVLKEEEQSSRAVECVSKMRRSCLEAARTGFSQTSMKTAFSSHSWQTGRGQHEWRKGRYRYTRDVSVCKCTHHASSWKNRTGGVPPSVRKNNNCSWSHRLIE